MIHSDSNMCVLLILGRQELSTETGVCMCTIGVGGVFNEDARAHSPTDLRYTLLRIKLLRKLRPITCFKFSSMKTCIFYKLAKK